MRAVTLNVQALYNVEGEDALWKELHGWSLEDGRLGLGAVLLSDKEICRVCGKKLSAKPSRAVNVVVYHVVKGTFMGCRIPKVCSKRLCSFPREVIA